MTLLLAALLLALTVPQVEPSRPEQRIVSQINRVRTEQGLQPLTVDPLLQVTSHVKAHKIIRTGCYAHQIGGEWPNGLLRRFGVPLPSQWPSDSNRVEALYLGSPRVSRQVEAFLESPSHRALLLSPQARQVGVSVRRFWLNGHRTGLVVVHITP